MKVLESDLAPTLKPAAVVMALFANDAGELPVKQTVLSDGADTNGLTANERAAIDPRWEVEEGKAPTAFQQFLADIRAKKPELAALLELAKKKPRGRAERQGNERAGVQ